MAYISYGGDDFENYPFERIILTSHSVFGCTSENLTSPQTLMCIDDGRVGPNTKYPDPFGRAKCQ